MGPAATTDCHRPVLTTPTRCSVPTDSDLQGLEKAQSAQKNGALTAEKARSSDPQEVHQ